AMESENIMKNRIGNLTGTVSRFNAVLSLVLVVVFFASCKGQSGLMNFSPGQTASQPAAITPGGVALPSSYADLVTRVSPAVVTIRSTEKTRTSQQVPFMDDPTFRQFFGDRLPQETPRRVEGLGSGVIVNPDGYILTNHHVVDGALEIRVELTDNHTYTAKLVGSAQAS